LREGERGPSTALRINIQVDFPDFRPAHHFRCVTSLFLHPDFRPTPRLSRMPLLPVGGKDMGPVNQWD